MFAALPLSCVVAVGMFDSTSGDTPRQVAACARVSAFATPPVKAMAGMAVPSQILANSASLPKAARVVQPDGQTGTPVPLFRMDACTTTKSPTAVDTCATGVTDALLPLAE